MPSPSTWSSPAKLCLLALGLLAGCAGSVTAQTGSESQVGYIDGAIPVNRFRLRMELDYDYQFPDRGGFGYSHSQMNPGESAETRADMQEFSAYLELALLENFSVFAEVPVRAINPTQDPDATGLSDVNGGVKWAFLSMDDFVASLQLRVYAPTGDRDKHLGSGHPTVEPGLLGYARLTDDLSLEGELRVWVPVLDTTGYDSTVVRYGIGGSYALYRGEKLTVSPVLELVGWTFVNGQKSVNLPDGTGVVVSAAGDTIVNVKIGVRFGTSWGDFYAGYGRALTGEPFYKDVARFEYRVTW